MVRCGPPSHGRRSARRHRTRRKSEPADSRSDRRLPDYPRRSVTRAVSGNAGGFRAQRSGDQRGDSDAVGDGGASRGTVFSVIGGCSAGSSRTGAGLSAASTEPQSRDHQASVEASCGMVPDPISAPPPSGLPSGPITRKPVSPGTTQPRRSRAWVLTYSTSFHRASSPWSSVMRCCRVVISVRALAICRA